MIQILFRILICILKKSCRGLCGEHFIFLLQPLKKFAKASKISFKIFGKNKFKKERGAVHWRASANQPAQPAKPARPPHACASPFPALAPAPRPRARTAAPCRRGEPAELGRRVARLRWLGRALVGHQVRPAVSASVPAARGTPLLALSPSLSLARSSSRTAARHCRRRSELLSLPALASSLSSASTSDSVLPFRTPCSCSTALGKPRVPGRAHRSESELRRSLGSCGSPSPLRHCLRS